MSEDPVVVAREARTRRVGAIAWPSFFAAGVATMWFFAVVDPIELAAISWPHAEVSRELGYTIGFFMFWACTASASLFTAMLLGPPARDVQARTQ
ncbi:MAG: hypothetical protein ABIR62_09950 [Dokdonella sp.]|uniref:hypothetical protein n=1 Tax=Dokdonella sp. TaxID=2291710 RepID=UPI003265AC62